MVPGADDVVQRTAVLSAPAHSGLHSDATAEESTGEVGTDIQNSGVQSIPCTSQPKQRADWATQRAENGAREYCQYLCDVRLLWKYIEEANDGEVESASRAIVVHFCGRLEKRDISKMFLK